LPKGYELNSAGLAWWKWAWKTPQACAWDDGAVYTVARRAQLETDLAMLTGDVGEDAVAIADLLAIPEDERVRELATVFGMVKRAASNEVTIMREMRELDNKLGLNPQALATLRWKIVDDSEDKPKSKAKSKPATVTRLRVVDPAA
jgi:hypothetical protein